MVADALTKSLPAPGLERHRSVMMGHSDFQVRLLHAVRAGLTLFCSLTVRLFTRLFRMGESDYLTDNAFVEAFLYEKKNWIFFLSFLFSKKECFFFPR